MSAIHRFSDQMIDYAERLANIADAAEGKRKSSSRNGTLRRWMLLPASGAAFYAVVKSDFVARRARGVMDEAKTRAADLPDDLMARVQQTTTSPPGTRTPKRRSSNTAARRTGPGANRSRTRKRSTAQRARTS